MSTEKDLEKFKENLDRLEGCCLDHPDDYRSHLVVSIEKENDPGAEEQGYTLFRTEDGLFGVLKEWSDYTGHG